MEANGKEEDWFAEKKKKTPQNSSKGWEDSVMEQAIQKESRRLSNRRNKGKEVREQFKRELE